MDVKSDLALAANPAVEKLLEFAKSKSFITWDEIIERLGQDFVNQDELMEPVLDKLKEINREPVETGIIGVDDEPQDDEIEESDEDDDSMILENDDEDGVQDDSVAEIEKAEKVKQKEELLKNSEIIELDMRSDEINRVNRFSQNLDKVLLFGGIGLLLFMIIFIEVAYKKMK